LVTTAGVIWLDVLQSILLAVGLALMLLIRRASRPRDSVLGHVPGMRGWHDVADHPDATTDPGLIVYRFGAEIVFFNAGYFRKRVLELVAGHAGLEWFVVDGSTMNMVDVTSVDMLDGLAGELSSRGVHLALAALHHDVRGRLGRAGVLEHIGAAFVFATLNTAREAFLSRKAHARE